MENDTRTAEEIQQDIERERSELSDTLSSLKDTFSVESIGASLNEQVRDMGSDVVDNLAGSLIERARQQPVAAGLVLAGLAWMALGTPGRNGTTPHGHSTPARDASEGLHGHRAPPEFESRRSSVDPRVARLAQDAKSLRDRILDGTETLSEEARDRVVKAREAAAEAAEKAVGAVQTGARKTKDAVQDNPVAIGGIALAIGAAVGGAVLARNHYNASREDRNRAFREADRIYQDELQRSRTPVQHGDRA